MSRERLDVLVVERGLAETRARAQAIIMGGGIAVGGVVTTKPGSQYPPDVEVTLVHQPMPYVSRGGLKLRHGLETFEISVTGRVAVDVGASTGGFTDVLLQAGVARVYAIDVGYGQLAWRIRTDERVVVMERTNIRTVTNLPEMPSLAVVDVSFISLRQVLPAVRRLLADRSDVVALIKPQFEAGRAQVGKKGVVRDPAVWADVLKRVLTQAKSEDWTVRGLERSPIQGPAGNVEFLVHLSRGGVAEYVDVDGAICRVVTVGASRDDTQIGTSH